MLDGLMRRAIFANADGVVRKYVGDGNLHQRAQPYRSSPVVAKNQESRSVGPKLGQCKAVEDRTHRVFPDPEVEIPARRTVGLKIASAGKRHACLCGRSEVRGPSDHPGKIRRAGVENFGGPLASRTPLRIAVTYRHVPPPTSPPPP